MDATTLERKMLLGYQGWFIAAGDGSQFRDEWHHWSYNAQLPTAENVMVDCRPDLTELDPSELHATGLRYRDGSIVGVYSSYDARTTMRHFKWMGQYGIDGVMSQRFIQEPQDSRALEFRDRILTHVRSGCETFGRTFIVEMDLSGGLPSGRSLDLVQREWRHLVDDLRVTESSRYLRDSGRPLVGIWGFGFPEANPMTPAEATAIVRWFAADAPEKYRATVVGGVTWDWRTAPGTRIDSSWAPVFRALDVISPWHVGAIHPSDVETFIADRVAKDVTEAARVGRRYLPVVFPGFSWSNMARNRPQPSPEFNSYPRAGGTFLWRQVNAHVRAGATMLKGAMFDEIDEGTALYKLAPTSAQAPAGTRFVVMDTDGQALPSDWYLRLVGAATRVVRGELPATPTTPISP